MPIPLIVWGLGALGTAIISGCSGSNDKTGDGGQLKLLDDTWQPKPDAGGVDNDSHNETDAAYDNPDAGVPPPDINTPNPDTQPTGPVDNDGDNFYLCGADEFAKLQNGQKVNCDCDDNNKSINPEAVQALGYVDTNCDGSVNVTLSKDAVKIVGESANDLIGNNNMTIGDVNHDGIVDVIAAAANHASGIGGEGKVGIFFGGAGKLIAGNTYSLADADVILIGGGGWSLGSNLAAVPAYGDTNQDGIIDNRDNCDLVIAAPSYNNGAGGGEFGDGSGDIEEEGLAAVLYIKGRANWQSKYAFYDVPNINNEHIVNGHSAQSLAQNGMGILKTMANDINLSYGPRFGSQVAANEFDLMLGNDDDVHLLPLKEYLGIQWMEDLRTTWLEDLNDAANTGDLGNRQTSDIDGDGVVDLIVSDYLSSNNDMDGNGRVTMLQGVEAAVPTKITLPIFEAPPRNQNNQIIPHATLSGAGNGDVVGTGVVVDDLQGTGNSVIALGASGQSGNLVRSGCVPMLFTDMFLPLFNGADLILNTQLPNKGIVLDGDASEASITLSGALASFWPALANNALLLIGAPIHPEGSRFYVADVSDNSMMQQFQVSTSGFQKVVGPNGFAKAFAKAGGHVLVGSPHEANDKGAAYYFPDLQ